MLRCTTLAILVVTTVTVQPNSIWAGRYNKQLSIGDAAPAWEKLPGVDDAEHSLADLKDKQAIVVMFTCNTCPYANDAERRVIDLHKRYADQGLAVVAISVNKNEEDRLPAMKERAQNQGYEFPYLYDESQQIARDFGAKYTPEFYVLDGDRKVVYMGAFDDSPLGGDVKQPYVETAVKSILSSAEQPKTTETAPVGCAIRYDRIRRKR